MKLRRDLIGTGKLVNMGEPSVGGTTAQISISYRGLFGLINTERLSLIKQRGNWKIDEY